MDAIERTKVKNLDKDYADNLETVNSIKHNLVILSKYPNIPKEEFENAKSVIEALECSIIEKKVDNRAKFTELDLLALENEALKLEIESLKASFRNRY